MAEGKREFNGVEGLSAVLIWFVAIAVVAAGMAFTSGVAAAFGIVVLIFTSAFAAGCFLGFLFGVPRVLSREGATPTPKTPAQEPTDQDVQGKDSGVSKPSASPVLQSNTNLERISDWLTTMIVGATLVQLHKVNEGLLAFRGFLAETTKVFGSATTANAGVLPAVGPIILIFGAVAGFLYMYLNTRLFLTRMFAQLEKYLQDGAEQKLDADETRAVAEAANESKVLGGFVREQLAKVSQMSVAEAVQLMRSALYRKGGYAETIRIAGAIANSAASNGQYWFLLAAAFGQQYAAAKAKKDGDAVMASARDNALDAARRAIALGPSYRKALHNLTDPRKSDNDLAVLYADDSELRALLG